MYSLQHYGKKEYKTAEENTYQVAKLSSLLVILPVQLQLQDFSYFQN